jgi:hypothetical protein
VAEEFLRTGQGQELDDSAKADGELSVDDAFASMIEEFRRKVAFRTGMPPSRVRVSVEFLSS